MLSSACATDLAFSPEIHTVIAKHFIPGVVLGMAMGFYACADDDDFAEVTPDDPVRGEQELFHAPTRLGTAEGAIDSGPSWGHSGPCVRDVDGDGARDLIVGDFSGKFHFYRNLENNRKPRYAKGVLLQAGGVDAKVPIY